MTGPTAGGYEKRSDHTRFDALIERSSLGTAGARRLRGRTSLTEGRFIGRLGRTWEIRIGIGPAAAPLTGPSEPDDADADYGHSRPGDLAAAGFWDALTPAQRDSFWSVAQARTFVAGARLMREGEQADHVVVILGGRVRISMHENDREWVIGERGLGDLVGERSALMVTGVSPTVTALEAVQALVMGTREFAGFISAHPEVLRIVENQVYSRLAQLQSAPGPARRYRPTGENCTVVRTDVVAFGARERDDQARRIIRQASSDMTRSALGPTWDACRWEDRGDGLLIVVPPDVSTARVIDRLLTVLPAELRRHNRIHSAPARIQLRVAVDVGPVLEDDIGMTGHSVIRASRLLDAPAFKQAITARGALLGLIVSSFIYQSCIGNGGGLLHPADYAQVPVQVKETRTSAWMHLDGTVAGAGEQLMPLCESPSDMMP